MEVVRGIENFPPNTQAAVCLTIGKFDGVHLGHQALLSETVTCASRRKGWPAVLTFHPHPAAVLNPQGDHKQLMDFDDLKSRLEQRGIHTLLLETFDKKMASLSAESFLEHLRRHVPLASILVGENFRFGSGQSGDCETLSAWGQRNGVEVVKVPSLTMMGQCVSSTTIRQFLLAGDFESARIMLGRSYYLRGEVIRGEGRGQSLGIPTANFLPTVNPPLKAGVYMGWCQAGGEKHRALLSIGHKPTFWRDQTYPLTYECHILDFQKDIYGETLAFEPRHFLRGEVQFDSPEDLLEQIQEDIAAAREML